MKMTTLVGTSKYGNVQGWKHAMDGNMQGWEHAMDGNMQGWEHARMGTLCIRLHLLAN